MAQLFVPVPYATIADALAAANPSDEIVLAAGYSGETVTVTLNNLTISGDASNTGIVLQVGGTANQLTLGGTLGASVIGEAAKTELLTGNAGNNTFTLVGGSSAANTATDFVDFGSGSSDRLILDYSAASTTITGLVNGLGSDGVNYQVYMGGQLRADAVNVDIFEITGGSGDDQITSFSGADILNGGGGNDQLNAQTGDDILNGGSGNDTLTGGGGNDTAVFSGNRSAYTFTQTGAATGTIVGTDGTDSVNGVEFFQFADGTFTFAQLAPNTAPTLTGFGPSITFGETLVNGTPQILDGDVNFNDAQGNFDGGVLALSGLLAEDRASIRNQGSAPGQIGYNAGTGAVSYGGVQIGTATGGVGNTLTVTLNAAATSIAVDALIENLTYANVSNTPTLNRTFNLSVTDSAGLTFGTAVDQLTEQTGAGNPFAGVDVGELANPALFDYDGDGDLDVVLGGAANPASASLRLFRNDNGATTFTEITGAANPFTVVGATPAFIAPGFGDIDGDGDKDLVLGVDTNSEGTVRTFRNDNGVFTELTGGANPFGATFGDSYPIPSFVDIDGDGDDDAVFGKGDGTLAVYRNENASLAFTLLTGGANPFNGLDFGTYTAPSFVDLDGDRDLDLVVGKGSAGLRSFRNDGAGVFTELVGAANPAQEVSSTDSVPIFGDLDGDGDPDLLVGQTDGTLRVYGNTLADTRFIAVTVNPENEAPTPQDDVLDGTEGADTIDALAGNDTVNGLGGNDLLIGNAGDDILNGGAGDDILNGGAGADQLNGGDGTDTADYSASTDFIQVFLNSSGGFGGDAQGDAYNSIENVTAGSGGAALAGSAVANVLTGGSGDDSIWGNAGNDTLIGGDGFDTVRYDNEAGNGGTQGVTVNLKLGTATDSYGFTDTLSGFEEIAGTQYADTLTGSDGADSLFGSDGDDILDGGLGADQMFTGAGNDVVFVNDAGDQVGENVGDGVDEIRSTLALTDLNNYSGIENLTGLLSTGQALIGNGGDNVLTGGDGDDVLNGSFGADTLNGGLGSDTATYGDNFNAVTINLATGATGGEATGDIYNSIENLTGSFAADSLTGDTNANVLSGGEGDDVLRGGGGADTLNGGLGSDTARFSGNRNAYSFAQLDPDSMTVTGPDGTDTVNDVEFFAFDDGVFAFADLLNTAPTLTGFGPSVTFLENTVNATPQLLDADVTFNDAEDNFAGGAVVLSGLLAEDRVSIQNQGAAPGQIGFDGTTVTYGGVAIGTASGGVGGTFTVTLNAAATSVAVDALIQSLTYANVSDTPTATRSLTLDVTDASGARISAPGPSNFTEDTSAGRPFAGVDVGQFSAPTFIDLDGDGDQDAVVGELNGTLLIFTNTAAAGQPASFTQNTDAGRPFGGEAFAPLPAPSFVDLDGDGDLDAVVGDNTGTLKVFTNVAAAGQPASFIQNNDAGRPFAGVDIGANSAPSFVDLDGDGDQDAVIGEEFGTLRIFTNTAAAGQPATFTENTAADRPFAGVDVSNLARPSFVDLDGDGDMDAVIGNTAGTLRIFTNTAVAGQPATFIEDTSAGRPFADVNVGNHSAPSFVDLDGDGDLDAVVGANDGTLRVFINSATPVSPTITVNVTAESDLDFVGTAADDVFIVNADGTYTRNGVGPGPLPSDLTLNAGAGDDLLVINNPTGSVQNRTFNYNGQTNSNDGTGDRLEIRGGTFTSAVYNYTNATDGSVVLTNGADVLTVNYTGLEPVLVDADAAPLTSTFNLGGFDTTFALVDNGNTPNDGQLLIDALDGTFEDTEFTEPTGLLTINGEGGNLAVNGVSQRNGDLTITSGGFLQTNGLVTLTGDLRLQAGGETDLNVNAGITNNSSDADAETITLTGQRSVGVNSVIQVANPATGGALNVNVASDSDGVGGGQVFINSTGAIRSNGGSINLSGGVDPATGRATGAFASQKGVVVLGELTSGAGAITVRGQGAGTGTDARGVQIEGAAAVVSSTSGLITIDGLGGPGGDFSRGVSVFNGARISTVDGGVSLTGLATASTGTQSSGIGIGNANTVIETTGSGAISITGVGASATGNINSGIGMFGGAQIRSTAAGATGSITLTGTGRGTGAQETGVQLDGGTLVSSRVGDIAITGRSDGTGTGAFHIGVLMFSGTNAIESTESADITINGTGGVSGSSGEGVYIFGATTQVRSLGSGDISITGEARIAASNAVIIQSGTLVGGATMSGDVLLRSLGGAGILLDNALIRTSASVGADVTLNLSAAGTAQQINGGSIIADGLRLLSSAASTFALTAAANDVNTIAGAITGSASFTDVDDLVVGTVTTASTAGAAATTTTGLSTTGALALTAGVLAVNANVSGSGVSLAARDSVTGSLSFASGVTIDGGAGGITLSAADDLTLAGATLTTTGALVINLDVGDADAEGATFSLGGDFTAASVTLNGGSESDSFTLTADVTGTLNGGAGDDVLTSGAGDQTLNGGSGIDSMTGGAGNDTYVVDDVADSVTELADGGDSDTVTTSLSTFILGVTAGSANVENLQGSGSADQILIGTAGANQISGADGNDTLVGGAGADALSGGGGVDYADYGISGAGVTIDLTAGTGLGGDAEGDTLTGIENVTGSYLNDTLLGDGAANALFGSVGDDVLDGGAGDDFLDGGLGIDSLSGGDGNDSIRFDADDSFVSGGAGFDIGYVTGGTRTVINLETASLEYVQDLAGGDDWFQGTFRTEAVTVFAGAGTDVVQGGAGNDVLWGEAGNDTIVGGAGADVLVGGSGADLMNGGAGRDILYGGVADGAQDLFRFTTGGAANWDFVREFEVGTDKIDLRAIATSFANVAVTVVGGNTNVSISGQLVCVVIGVTNLTDNDFLLGAPGSSMADLFKDDLPFVQPADAEVALIPSHDFDVGMFDFADGSGQRSSSHALTSDYDWIV